MFLYLEATQLVQISFLSFSHCRTEGFVIGMGLKFQRTVCVLDDLIHHFISRFVSLVKGRLENFGCICKTFLRLLKRGTCNHVESLPKSYILYLQVFFHAVCMLLIAFF